MRWFCVAMFAVLAVGCEGGKKTPKSKFTAGEVAANIEILKDESRSKFQRAKAARNLAQAPEYDEATAALIEVAKSQTDPEVRQEAVLALCDHAARHKEVVKVLIDLAKDRDAKIRKTVADALGNVTRKGALEGLIILLGDKEADVRRVAISSLAKLGECPPADVLKRLVRDEERDIAEAAAEFVLKHIDNPDVDYSEVVVAALGSKDGAVLQMACEAAGKGRIMKAADQVKRLLGHRLAVVRAAAAKAAGLLDLRDAAKAVAALVYDADEQVAVAALEALAEIGSPQQTTAILAGLKNESSDAVREAAIRTVKALHLADPKIIEALKFIKQNDPATKLRELAEEALSELGR